MPLLDTITRESETRFIARCTVKGCKATVSALIAVTTTTSTYGLPTGGGWQRRSTTKHDLSTAPGWQTGGGYLYPPDPCGHDRMRVKAVRGIVSEDRTCDARCEGATGPNCECQCGGRNHGGAYAN